MLFNSLDKKSLAYNIDAMKRRPLTSEELAEAQRLTAAWNDFRKQTSGATQAWLATTAGLGTQGAVSQYLRGAIPLNLQALLAICGVIRAKPHEISPRLMKGLEDSIHASLSKKPLHFPEASTDTASDPGLNRVEIPKVKLRLTAGTEHFEIDSLHQDRSTTAPQRWMRIMKYDVSDLIAIEAPDSAMEPLFWPGDTLVINTMQNAVADGFVFAINYEGELIVRRAVRDAGEWWFVADNADQRRYPKKLWQPESAVLIGRVVRVETERV